MHDLIQLVETTTLSICLLCLWGLWATTKGD